MPEESAQVYFKARGTYCAIERSYPCSWRSDNLEDLAVLVEELLVSFTTAALGFTLKSRIQEVNQLPEVHLRPTELPSDGARVCAAWHTTEGRVIIRATYHAEHSQRVKGVVLWLEWWIPPNIHHEGWWRVERKWPRDWIKGHG